jgi:hypothetical protein
MRPNIVSSQGCGNELHWDTDYKVEPKIGAEAHAKMPTNETLIVPTSSHYTWINGD